MRHQVRRVGWAIAQSSAVVLALAIGLADAGVAQIVPDGTLGAEGSRVTPNVQIKGDAADRIDGGAARGANLFHSFQEFNVGNGQRVYFANPANVRNILTRVTGNNLSNILGTLGVDGGANLFLMNPNGIVFGQNARLDVAGSFVGTTGDRFNFSDGFSFSVSNPQAPPLLTVSSPIGLQMGTTPGRIVNQVGSVDGIFTLSVNTGRTLALIGGDITLDSGNMFTTTGHILLGALGKGAIVGLEADSPQVQVSIPANTPLSNLSIANGSAVYTFGGGSIQLWGGQIALDNAALVFTQNGGDLSVRAAQLSLDRGSSLASLTQTAANGGAINIQASDLVGVASQSLIFSSSNQGATGNAGSISIDTPNLTLRGFGLISSSASASGNSGNISLTTRTLNLRTQSFIQTGTTGAGNSGSISVQARNAITLSDSFLSTSTDNLNPDRVSDLTFGRAGDISLDTQRLQITDGSSVNSRTSSSGNAGNIQIRATEAAEIQGSSSNATSNIRSNTSGFRNNTLPANITGNSGNLSIDTGRLAVTNGGIVSTESSRSRGNSGDIAIRAREVEVSGFVTSADRVNISSINAQITNNDTAVQSGNIAIDTDRLALSNGGYISTQVQNGRGRAGDINIQAADSLNISGIATRPNNPAGIFATVQTNGIGSGGNIRIMAHRLNLDNQGEISAATFSKGDAGSVSIAANQINLSNQARINAQVSSGATGSAGNLDIKTQQLRVQNNAQINTSTFGAGNAGDLTIRAHDIEVTGAPASNVDTGLFASVNSGATGNAGRLTIDTDRLTLRNGAFIGSTTEGKGRGGDLQINASNQVLLADSSYISSGVFGGGQGNSGNIALVTPQLILQNASGITANTAGQGNAGNITIRVNHLFVRGSSTINTSTSGQGNAGNLFVNAAHSIVLTGVNPSTGINFGGLSTVATPEAKGRAGNIQVQTDRLLISDGAAISASTRGQGRAGDITINANERIQIEGTRPNDPLPSGIFARTLDNAQGRSGNITLTTPDLQVTQSGLISAETQTNFQGGNITLNADRIRFTTGGRAVTTASSGGQAGNLNVNADRILLDSANASQPQFQTTGFFANTDRNSTGQAGDIRIRTSQLNIQDNAKVAIDSQGTGRAGSLNITARNVLLDRGTITANTVSSQGGNIDLTIADSLQLRNNSQISALTQNGQGGRLALNASPTLHTPARTVTLRSGSSITTEAKGSGNAGSLSLNTRQLTVQGDRSAISASSQSRTGGDITLNTELTTVSNGAEISASTQTGQAGSININASDSVQVSDRGRISVQAARKGGAGNLNIITDSISLDNGTLTATTGITQGDKGANIALQEIDRLLYLQNGSQISARAFDNANGGNVTINANNGFVVARVGASQNNDIIARASGGNGGQVTITAQGILGLEQRSSNPANTTNDIDISSERGLQGTATLNIPNTDPSQGLIELPTIPIDATNQIAAACPTNAQEADRFGSFIVSGRGGLPPNPIDLLSEDNILTEWVTSGHPSNAKVEAPSPTSTQPIVEAQGWTIDSQGKVKLVAQSTPQITSPALCQQR